MSNISPKDAKNMIEESNVSVIDVRTPNEFAGGHIDGAENINFNDASFSEKIKELDREKTYIVNCQMGGRSARAVSLMKELGFKNVFNLEGGFEAWSK